MTDEKRMLRLLGILEKDIDRLKAELAEKRDEAMRLRAENDRLHAGLSREQAQMVTRGMDIPWVRACVERLDSLLNDGAL